MLVDLKLLINLNTLIIARTLPFTIKRFQLLISS
jgi:hypothetical protein